MTPEAKGHSTNLKPRLFCDSLRIPMAELVRNRPVETVTSEDCSVGAYDHQAPRDLVSVKYKKFTKTGPTNLILILIAPNSSNLERKHHTAIC